MTGGLEASSWRGSEIAASKISGLDFSSVYPQLSDASGDRPSFAAVGWESIKPALDSARGVNFTTAAENAANSAQPDFFLGEDGQLRANPAKTTPSADGKLNIQMEGPANASEIEAAKVANQLQKQAAQEMISYFQKNNPGAEIPQHWLAMLNKDPDIPTAIPRNTAETPAPTPGPSEAPAPQQRFNPGGLSSNLGGSPGGGSPGGGAERFSNHGTYRGENYGTNDRGQRVDLPPPLQGDLRVDGPNTITAEKIDEVLAQFHSPAQGIGKDLIAMGEKYNINAAVALAFFIQESSAGTKGAAVRNNSWGNIKGSGPAGSDGTFRTYHNFTEGAEDWFRLIRNKYLASPNEGGFGAQTLSQIISKYAPGSDNNNERGYVATVKGLVSGWAKQTGKDNPATA
jgi:hypothetical protein